MALTTVLTSSALLVDSTPPILGHVYDGNVATDQDFQVFFYNISSFFSLVTAEGLQKHLS